MRADGNFGRAKNYEPNSYGGPAETGEPLYAGLATNGPNARAANRSANMLWRTSGGR